MYLRKSYFKSGYIIILSYRQLYVKLKKITSKYQKKYTKCGICGILYKKLKEKGRNLMKNLRKTKIVCTVGPASEDKLVQLMNAGMDVVRINFSHGSYPEQKRVIDKFFEAKKQVTKPVALLLDMQGPEVRTGMLENAPAVLKKGETFTLVNEDIVGNDTKVSVTYKKLYEDVQIGTKILIDDGLIEIEVTEIKGKDIVCKILNGGKLGNRKSINIPGIHLKLPALKEKDIQDLKDGAKAGFDYVAASFVRSKEDIFEIRKVLDENGGKDIKIICKIENQEGLDNLEEIVDNSAGIMIGRGDLGVEIPCQEVPIAQKNIIKMCNRKGKVVITATQMLESMTHNPRPTRAEVSDVANAVYDRTGAIMLSGECATGEYPVECVQTMVNISSAIEDQIKYWERFDNKYQKLDTDDLEYNINYTVGRMAQKVNAKAIVAYTNTGNTARYLSGLGVKCPIFAVTSNEKTYNQLALIWNVIPTLLPEQKTINELMDIGLTKLEEEGYLEKGDRVIIAGGSYMYPTREKSKIIGGIVEI